jgi:hypothetical protein
MIGIGRTTIRSRFNKQDYIYENKLNKYIYDNSKANVPSNKIITSMTNVTSSENKDLNEYSDNSKTFVTDDKAIKNLMVLSDNYDKLIEIIEWFKNHSMKKSAMEIIQGIRIKLPKEQNKEYRKTIRINDVVWNKFIEFCDLHKEFTQKDLHSQAMLEFMEKHK